MQSLTGIPELHAFFDDAPVGLALLGTDLRYVRVNPALAAINGTSVEAHLGRRPTDVLGALGEVVEAGYARAVADDAAHTIEVTGRTPAAPGVDGRWHVTYHPVHDEAGEITGVGAVVSDVSARHRAEAESERLRRRAEFLARSAELLASSLDADATVQAVVEAAVPELGDWCACTVVDGDVVRLLALAHGDLALDAAADEIRARWPQALGDDSPVPMAIRTRAPVMIALEDDAANPNLQALRALGATSVLAVPLLAPSGIVGAIGMLHTSSGRRHGAHDLETAQALADRAAVAIAHARAHDSAQRRLALLDALFDSAPVGLTFVDEGLRYQRVNDKLAELNGVPAAEHVGRTPTDVLGQELGASVEDVLRAVLATGTIAGEVSTPDDRHFLATFAPVELEDHQLGVTGVIMDITARKREEEHERLLGRIGEALDAEFDVLAAAHRLCLELAAELGAHSAVRLTEGEVAVEAGDAAPGGRELVLPLVTRGRPMGTLTVTAGARGLGEDDELLLYDVARRAAVSLDLLALYAGQKQIASTLQARLLPRTIPHVPGVEVATRYRAAGVHNDVGGDFYDLFPHGEGRWTALVGDVAGKGAEAAALTASIRQIVRTGSRWSRSAAELLGVVNDELLADADARACTLAHAELFEEGPDLRVEITLAGHPLPAVRRADGTVEWVGEPGTLLGGLRTLELVTAGVVLRPGDLLLLYTDGAVEGARGRAGGEILDLAPVIAASPPDAAEVVRRVEEAAVEAAGGRPSDDIALVGLLRR